MTRLVRDRMLVPVTAAPAFDPGARRIDLELPAGMTIAAMVEAALPEAHDHALARVRVHLVTAQGSWLIERAHWHAVRPRPGVHVVIRLVSGKSSLRAVLQILVVVAANFLAPGIGGAIAELGIGISAAAGTALASAAILTAGALLINALVPPASTDSRRDDPAYSISGWRNQLTPDAPVPAVVGRHRFAPPFAAYSYSEIVGDQQYVRALFCVGYGPVSISDIRIGDTSIDEYDEVQIETRQGLASDAPLTLYPAQVIEEQYFVDLRFDYPRDDKGDIEAGSSPEESPVVRLTAADAAGAAVIIAFPGGLVAFDDKGRRASRSVQLRIRHRPVSSGAWSSEEITISHRTTESFFRSHRIDFATRGRHEIEVTRLSPHSSDSSVSDRTVYSALQSFRPEYPLAFGKPLAVIAIRVRATYQLNGALDSVNAIVTRIAPDWDAATGTWQVRETRNPASLFVWLLRTLTAKPVNDTGIDWETMRDWHAFCALKGLKYDRVLNEEASLLEQLKACAAAGRASPRHDGTRWTVVIDRPRSLVVDHVNSRNAHSFRWSRAYVEPPHGFRVPFLDQSNNYQSAERIIPWPGHTGEVTITEELQLPGKTDPYEIWVEARRRQYEIIHRPERYQAIQDGAVRVATRGDLVMSNFDVLDQLVAAARVLSTDGRLIEIDEPVTFIAGESYVVRWREFNADDTIGESVIAAIDATPGEMRTFKLISGARKPQRGDIVHVGTSTTESLAAIVTGTEAAEEMGTVLHMLPAAPQIDVLTDAENPPAWDGRVGEINPDGSGYPLPPVVTGVSTGFIGAGETGKAVVTVRPGAGSAVQLAAYKFEYRESGAPDWLPVTVPASTAALTLDGYATGDMIELRVKAVSIADKESAFTSIIEIEIGEDDTGLPVGIIAGTVSVTGGLGMASIEMTPGANTETLRVYRQAGSGGELDREADFIRDLAASPSVSLYHADGDATRVNLIVNGGFDTGADWVFGGGWAHDTDKATHTPGVGSNLQQFLALEDGETYRGKFVVSSVTAGQVRPLIAGGGGGPIGSYVGSDGDHLFSLVPVPGNTYFSMNAQPTFDGSVDGIELYKETAACIPQGEHTWWFEPLNTDGQPGPLAGPFTATVR